MTSESICFLDANRHHYDLLIKAGYVKQLDGATIQGLLAVVRKEWSPGYLINSWCGECVMNMIKFAYTQYDKWIENNKLKA
jgi:hypothetical protein